jgi:hypothetical protein
LLTADWFCVELSGDAEFKASLAGRLGLNYGNLRLRTVKSKARRVLELHESFSSCQICTKYYKIFICNVIFPFSCAFCRGIANIPVNKSNCF